MMRFCSLGSGSSGNATLIEHRGMGRTTRVLVDCGFSLRELTRRLQRRGVLPDEIDALFVTHEHSDHVGCALALRRRHGVALWTSEGTWRSMRGSEAAPAPARFARHGEPIDVGGLQVNPFAVPHDAAQPLQLVCGDGARRLGVLTDLGETPPEVAAALHACDALLLETNHDAQMLAQGPYPTYLKRRVGGARGHLANAQSARLLAAIAHDGLRHVVAAHLSRQNNRPELAAAALAGALGAAADMIVIADAVTGSPWLDLG